MQIIFSGSYKEKHEIRLSHINLINTIKTTYALSIDQHGGKGSLHLINHRNVSL